MESKNWSKVMMPIIAGLLFVLAIRGLTLPGGSEGLRFLFLLLDLKNLRHLQLFQR